MDLVLSNKELCVLCSFQLVIGIIHFGIENSYKYILVPEPPLGLGQTQGWWFWADTCSFTKYSYTFKLVKCDQNVMKCK